MKNKIFVWDFPVRAFHWLLVISLVAAWYSSDGERDLIEYHLLIGYFILGLIIFRIIWGVFGTKYAKFSQFFPTKKSLLAYIRNVNQQENAHNLGHNPLGGLMVVLMLTLLLSQAISGLFMNDDVFTSGPYYDAVNSTTQKTMAFIHHNFFDAIIIATVFHISAVIYYLLVKKVNLIVPMLTGYKNVEHEKSRGIESSKLLLALVIIILVSAFLYWLLVLNIPVEEEIYF